MTDSTNPEESVKHTEWCSYGEVTRSRYLSGYCTCGAIARGVYRIAKAGIPTEGAHPEFYVGDDGEWLPPRASPPVAEVKVNTFSGKADPAPVWQNGEQESGQFMGIDLAQYINHLAEFIHHENVAKGFWPVNKTERNVGEALMLVVSELSEALEAHRKDLMDSHLPNRKGLEVEVADAIIRLLDMNGFGLDIGGALVEKLAYNRSRPYKHGKKY